MMIDGRGGNQKRRRRSGNYPRKKVRKFGPDEDEVVDVIALTDLFKFYGYIDSIEDEYWTGAVARQHITFECIDVNWFNGCWGQNYFPDVDRIARNARVRHVEIVVSPNVIQAANQSLGDVFGSRGYMPHIHIGNWVGLALSDTTGVPCTVYLPADGSDDPATIGWESNEYETLADIYRLNPMLVTQLRRFSDELWL
jgi:hypothetical protein